MTSIFDSAPAAARWPRYQHVIFDCDSTLSAIEGIDQLADQPETRRQVVDLTNAAMDGLVPLDSVYGKRLSLISPTRQAILDLADQYLAAMVTDAKTVVETLLACGCDVYIVSGGLLEPVKEFGISLGVDASNIHAVEVEYDQLGESWWRHDQADKPGFRRYLAYQPSDLVISDGKSRLIRSLLDGRDGTSMLIGDGVSDLLARNAVDLFVGYGGVIERNQVKMAAPVYLRSPSLLPVLTLALGDPGFFKLDPPLRDATLAMTRTHYPLFNRQVLARHFERSFS